MNDVVIGVDPHKLSAAIEVVDAREALLGSAGSHRPGRLHRDAHLREGLARPGLGG